MKDLELLANLRLNHEYNVLKLKADTPLPEILPGQFVEIRVDNSSTTFLRRPMSVHDVDYAENTMDILVQAVGDGSKKLMTLEAGTMVNLLYPLGNSFTWPKEGQRVLMIGGGCGIAPFLYTGRKLAEAGIRPLFLLGARTKEGLIRLDEYSQYGDVYTTTEDGSHGQKGFVIHHDILWEANKKFDMIYTCGPEPMMRAVGKYAKKQNIFCEASLENKMACGFGVCLCCVEDTTTGNRCVCTDGPVFNVNELKW